MNNGASRKAVFFRLGADLRLLTGAPARMRATANGAVYRSHRHHAMNDQIWRSLFRKLDSLPSKSKHAFSERI